MAFQQGEVDSTKIDSPELGLTVRARQQLDLIWENDYTIQDKVLRLAIQGKGCDGFNYAVYFEHAKTGDIQCVAWNQKDLSFPIVSDSFTAYYLQEATLDFIQDPDQEIEGFVVINHNQDKFKGKFWRSKPDLTPPLNN